ncbi:MAG: hypothetical protein ACOYN0_01560 [Phycisphaerales bacterium]
MKERLLMLNDLQTARGQAEELLRSLLEAKGNVESVGNRDLFRVVTGASSLDNAVESARRAVETYDRMLAELSKDPAPADVR